MWTNRMTNGLTGRMWMAAGLMAGGLGSAATAGDNWFASLSFNRPEPTCHTSPVVCSERPRQVWREPVYEVREVFVDVPARVERQRVPVYCSRGRVIGHRWVEVVVPARREVRLEKVLVRPGYWDTVVERICPEPRNHVAVGVGGVAVNVGWDRPDVGKARPYPYEPRPGFRPVRDRGSNFAAGFEWDRY